MSILAQLDKKIHEKNAYKVNLTYEGKKHYALGDANKEAANTEHNMRKEISQIIPYKDNGSENRVDTAHSRGNINNFFLVYVSSFSPFCLFISYEQMRGIKHIYKYLCAVHHDRLWGVYQRHI